MSTAVAFDAQMMHNLALVAENESMTKKLAKYLKKLVLPKTDPTLMTKDEFFARVDEAREQRMRGEYATIEHGEDLTDFLRRQGYDL